MVVGLGLQRRGTLSVINTHTAELPAGQELQELNLGSTLWGYVAPEALASCRSRESLGLDSGFIGFNRVEPGFLAATPGLRTLNLTGGVPCCARMKQGLCQDRRPRICPTTGCLPCASPLSPGELLLQGNRLICLGSQGFQGLRRLEILDMAEIHWQPQARAGRLLCPH